MVPTIAALVLTFTSVAWADAPRQAVKVIDVVDGDTIGILVDDKRVRVRLEGIDAPETKQDALGLLYTVVQQSTKPLPKPERTRKR